MQLDVHAAPFGGPSRSRSGLLGGLCLFFLGGCCFQPVGTGDGGGESSTTGSVSTTGGGSTGNGASSGGAGGASSTGGGSGTTGGGSSGGSTTGGPCVPTDAGVILENGRITDAGQGAEAQEGDGCDARDNPGYCFSAGLFCYRCHVDWPPPYYCCEKPSLGLRCNPARGCFDPLLACVAGFQSGSLAPIDATESVCLTICKTSSDCVDPDRSCQSISGVNVCAPVRCGPGTCNGEFFSDCTIPGVGTGTCDLMADYFQQFGFCRETGPVSFGQPCSLRRGGDAGLCDAVTDCFCDNTWPGSCTADSIGMCQPSCHFQGDGGECGPGTSCSIRMGSPFDDSFGLGLCVPCGDGGSPCP